MSTTAETAHAPAATAGLLQSRLGSLLAFLPLALWVPWHLYQNLTAWQGPTEWQAAVSSERSPVVEILTTTLVLLPIVLHTLWGIRRITMARYNVQRYGYLDNVKFAFQRLSALGLLLFLPAHIYLARISPMLAHGRHETFADISHEIHFNGPTLPVYVLGVLGIAYHLANGFYTGSLTWGFAASKPARKRVEWLSYLFFVVLLAMGWGSVYALWEAGGHPSTGRPVSAEPAVTTESR